MTRPHVLVLQHVPWERPAVLGEVLTASGIDWTLDTIVERRELPPAREITGFDGLVLLGGPMGALDVEEHPGLGLEAQLVRDAAVLGIPVFGSVSGISSSRRPSEPPSTRRPRTRWVSATSSS
ncbi:hypothetical protein [Plantibacter sp. M259]|uniref:hypothetical protein n=1 Tax=Plantibacter sp. M259 TaxID=2583822 RepID=UPI0011101FFF|nr:hypothetical protein [Plantibacter sp. M259]